MCLMLDWWITKEMINYKFRSPRKANIIMKCDLYRELVTLIWAQVYI